MKLMRFRRTPRRSFVRISGIIAFAPIKKTLRESRHGRASPAMCGDHAVELTQLTEGFAVAQPQPLHAQAGR